MRIEQMRQLVEIAKYKSLNTASQNMHITQQALSVSVKKMEEELDCKLLSRTTHGVSLTEQGSYYAQGFNKLLKDYDALVQETKNERKTEKKEIKISANFGCMETFLAEVVSSFLSNDESIRIHVTEDSYQKTVDDVLAKRSDLAIVCYNKYTAGSITGKKGVKTIELFTSPLYIKVSTESPLATKSAVSLNNLADTKVAIYNDKRWGRNYMQETFEAYGKNLNYVFEENYQMHANMVRSGYAVSFAILNGKFYSFERGLKYVRISDPIEVTVSCVLNEDKEVSVEMQYFINYMQMECNN